MCFRIVELKSISFRKEFLDIELYPLLIYKLNFIIFLPS